MRFGHFDDAAREYVITTPRTPYPWINYLGTEEFFGLVSHTGGGYCFYRDARLRRLTRYRYNNVPTDVGGRYYYVHDGGDYWTPGLGAGQARARLLRVPRRPLVHEDHGRAEGPPGRGPLLRPARHDRRGAPGHARRTPRTATKSVKLFSFVEFCLWNASDDQNNYQRNLSIGEVEVDGSTIYHKTEYRERRNHYAFYSVNAQVAGFDTDRESFLGPWNGFGEPQVVAEGKSRNSVASGWSPIGSHQLAVDLAPGEEKTLRLRARLRREPGRRRSGRSRASSTRSGPRELLARFQTTAQVDAALAALRDYWTEMLSKYTVKSGDERLDRMVNIWNPYQCMVTFNMSRSASYFETGIGRGMGFRDSNQDLLGFVHLVPSRAKERILDIAATQKPDGSAYHQYQPLTKRGNNDIGSRLQRRPAVAHLGDGRLRQGDGRLRDPEGDGALRQRPEGRGAALRAPEALVPPRARTTSARTACRSSAARTGTTA